MQKWFKNENHY